MNLEFKKTARNTNLKTGDSWLMDPNVPVSLSKARFQICPSSEVVKWFSDHIILKFSSKDCVGTAVIEEDTIRAATKKSTAAMEEYLFSIVLSQLRIFQRERGRT
ncbi:hypothetical protein IGI04_021820 [Brassica rapa subsp. trilocularis]|uniref:Uncharacterized protein n=1 Tax=Brassica rapa subsp. trilocularis TaxID=1813537 RepID=A0ABQ7LZV1_BRACM|nr:hypothetical protein IGI04_021820 [Brassica rapa subsp. trilocularis]